jgi:hypothetical protein
MEDKWTRGRTEQIFGHGKNQMVSMLGFVGQEVKIKTTLWVLTKQLKMYSVFFTHGL